MESRLFQISEQVLPEVVDLLTEVTLGTTGVRYKHLDTHQRVLEVDTPLFLYLKRREQVLGNITFCRRGKDWYIRYFAFRSKLQRTTETKTEDRSSSVLKKEISSFFKAAFSGEVDGTTVEQFYAYIDPKNDRSKWMSTNFGFQKMATLSTQTFSRLFPKKSNRFQLVAPNDELKAAVIHHFGNHAFFFDAFLDKNKYGILRDEEGALLGFCRVTMAHWKIESLGGKNGEWKAKVLTKTPLINRLIYPPRHTFVVPDSVWVNDGNPQLLTELYESLIQETQAHMLIWWTDVNEPLYLSAKNKVNWGPMHKVLGTSPVDVVGKRKEDEVEKLTQPMYVVAIDAI